MACNCKSDLEAKVVDRLKEEYPEGENHQASLGANYLYALEDFGQLGRMEFANEVVVTTKKGTKRTIKPKLSMVFTFCPFCGVRYKEKKETQEATA